MDQMTIYMIIWIGLMIVFSIIEIATAALTTVWFVGGCVAALIAGFFGAPFILQVAAFIAVSFIMLFLLRPYAVKKMFGNPTKTNVDELHGQEGFVISPISSQNDGLVKVKGQIWTAFTQGEEIAKEENIIVVDVRGVKLLVKRK